MSVPEVCKQCGKLAFPGATVTISTEEYEELRRFKAARTNVHKQLSLACPRQVVRFKSNA